MDSPLSPRDKFQGDGNRRQESEGRCNVFINKLLVKSYIWRRVLGNFSSLLQTKIIQPVIKILKLDFTSIQVIVCRLVQLFIVTIFLEVEHEVFSSCIVCDVFGFICLC